MSTESLASVIEAQKDSEKGILEHIQAYFNISGVEALVNLTLLPENATHNHTHTLVDPSILLNLELPHLQVRA